MITVYVITATAALVISWLLTGVLRRVAIAHAWFDLPTEARRVHARPTPRIGGVVIAATTLVAAISSVAWHVSLGPGESDKLLGVLGGGALLVGVGLVDDLHGLSASKKLAAQVLAAGFAQWHGLQISSIGVPFGSTIELGWLGVPVTTLWIVGVTNALNLIDGLDGLAAGTGSFAAIAIFVIAAVDGNVLVALVSAALVGALLGFLRHNFQPASIFMGDSGSLFLGYTLGAIAIWGSTKSSAAVSLAIPLLLLGLPIADAVLAIVRRFVRGGSIFSADREHIHHRLLARGMTHRGAVLVLYAAAALLALASLGLELGDDAQDTMILAAVAVLVLVAAKILRVGSWREALRTVRYGLLRRHRTLARMRVLDGFGARLRATRSVDELREALHGLSMTIDLESMLCRVEIERCSQGHPRRAYEWTWSGPASVAPTGVDEPERMELCFSLDDQAGDVTITGTLAFRWRCPSSLLQIPEQPIYEWLALLLRKRLLALHVHEPASEQHAPQAARPRGTSGRLPMADGGRKASHDAVVAAVAEL